jgi:predicted HAD superfamily phosphohydrolase YqeG
LKRDFKKLKTVLLDLDETLIHSEEWEAGKKYDIEVEIEIEDGSKDVRILTSNFK